MAITCVKGVKGLGFSSQATTLIGCFPKLLEDLLLAARPLLGDHRPAQALISLILTNLFLSTG